VVPLGVERLVLDAPPGFSDTMPLGSPRLLELAEAAAPPSSRILLFAVTDADLRAFMTGDRMELRRYALAVTPARLERERVDAGLFAALVEESLRGLGPAEGAADLAGRLAEARPGEARLLEELHRAEGRVSVLQATRLPPQGRFFERPRFLLFSTTVLLLRGKALQLTLYSLYDGAADLEWVRFATRRWVDDLVRLNRDRP